MSLCAGNFFFPLNHLQVIEVPIIAGLFGAKIRPVTWVAAAAAIAGVGLLESSAADSSFVSTFMIRGALQRFVQHSI